MTSFEFSYEVRSKIINELIEAKEYIRIAIFQIHYIKVFEILLKKLHEGLRIEIFTLPYDSINDEVRERVSESFRELEINGAKIYLCKWNIGNPERTTTAVGRWYSYHGKFIVTDKSAIALSANMTDTDELDAVLFIKNNPSVIVEFNKKFDELVSLFISSLAGYDGKIRSTISCTEISKKMNLFQLPKVITTDTYKNHWITDYPSELCPNEIVFKDQLLICPFDIRGRKIILDLISRSETFLFISTESFTDEEIVFELIKKKVNSSNIDIRVLTGAKSMDFTDRLNDMLRQLLASGIDVRTTEGNLHAKLMVSNNFVAVSSINLNRINLGFQKNSQLWRENTETIATCSDLEVISSAKDQYQDIFSKCSEITTPLALKIEGEVKNIFRTYYGLNSCREAKTIFSRYILNNEIQVKKISMKIGSIAKRLLFYAGHKTIQKDDLLKALILYFLSERKHNLYQIEEKLDVLKTETNLPQLINSLIRDNFIEKEDDYFKLKIESLFLGEVK